MRKRLRRPRATCSPRTTSGRPAPRDIGYLDLTGCMALGITGPVLRSTGLPHDLRKTQPYCGYETYDFDVPTDDSCDAYGRYLIRIKEMHESLKIVEQCARPAGSRAGTGDGRRQEARLARPAGARPRRARQLAWSTSQDHGPSMEALIHHFKLVTEGFRVPAGQVYVAVESPRGELGVHMVSDGGTRPYRVHFRDPSFTNLQAVAAMCEGGMVADVIVAVASHRPGDGRRGPLMRAVRPSEERDADRPSTGQTRRADARRSSPATRSRARRCCRCCTWCSPRTATSPRTGIAFCAAQLGLTDGRGHRGRDLLLDVPAHADRRVPGRRVHQHAVRGDGRRRDPRRAAGPPRRRHDETHRDGKVTLEHIECNAACDYAPVVMVNWEFFDNQTPASARELVDELRAGRAIAPTRGAPCAPSRRPRDPRRVRRRPRRRRGPASAAATACWRAAGWPGRTAATASGRRDKSAAGAPGSRRHRNRRAAEPMPPDDGGSERPDTI